MMYFTSHDLITLNNTLMKHLLFMLLIIPVVGHGQIKQITLPELKKIGEVKYMGEFLAEISYTVNTNNDTSYSLLFDNVKYTHIKDLVRVDFENSPGILDTLYNLLNNGFDLDNGKQSNFYLGKDFISITSDKAMGIKFIKILALDKKGHFYLRKKQLNDLFGKK